MVKGPSLFSSSCMYLALKFKAWPKCPSFSRLLSNFICLSLSNLSRSFMILSKELSCVCTSTVMVVIVKREQVQHTMKDLIV